MDDIGSVHSAWLAEQQRLLERREGLKNPCLQVYGAGPEGARCHTCFHLGRRHNSNTRWRCYERAEARGVNTDHNPKWFACGKYRERS